MIIPPVERRAVTWKSYVRAKSQAIVGQKRLKPWESLSQKRDHRQKIRTHTTKQIEDDIVLFSELSQ